MWFKVAAIAALCVTGATAQPQAPMVMQNCTTQVGNDTFRYCFMTPGLDPPTTVFWNPATGTPPAIDFAFEAMEGVWRGVGFSNGAPDAMINGPANVVMGCVRQAVAARNFAETPAGADFALVQKNSGGVASRGNQGLVNWSQEFLNNVCSVRFRRPVTLVVDPALPLQALGDRDQIVIAARGPDNDEAIAMSHPNGVATGRIFFPVNFANPANLVQPGGPDDMTTMTMPPGQTDAPAGNDASTRSASMTIVPVIVGSIFVALW